MKITVILSAIALFAGCSDVASKNNTSANNTSSNNESNEPNNEPNNESNTTNNVSECEGPSPECGVCAAPDCVDGVWTCLDTPCDPNSLTNNDPQPECVTTGESSLAGAEIVFMGDRCSWTLEEVAAGVEIPYVITISEEQQITPESQQNGCDEPGPSGLRQQERIFGMDQSYCICDVGLCGPGPVVVDLVPGEYEFAVQWDGVNWIGPSDFGNPKGEPFPPGEYTVQVRAVGTAHDVPYEVTANMQIWLTE